MSKVIGIDLGTGRSCVAVLEGGQPNVIINDEGQRTTPSVVGFSNDGERKVGDPARRQAITNPQNTVSFIKRFMGEKYDNVKFDVDRATYKVEKDSNGNPRVNIDGKQYSPEEISAIILQKMKKTAEDYLGTKVEDAVITCPAYYDNTAREAVKAAGKIAGLNVLRIVNEPTAAALAYGLDKGKEGSKIAVYDFGSGTLDISILDLSDGVLEVLSTNGDTHLGGEDFDQAIINWLADEFQKDNGVDLRKDPMAMQRLKEAAEKAKIELSSQNSTEINLPYIMPVDGIPKHLVTTLTRAKFEAICDDIFKKAIAPAADALKKAKVEKSDIDDVILVGGSTRIPKVQEIVKNFFGKEPNKSVNPDEAVACGAAILGAQLGGDTSASNILLLDVVPLSISIETLGGVATKMVEANTTVPVKKSQIFSTAADNQPSISVRICQGERPMFADNKLLGEFYLDGIAPAPRGVPQLEVTVDIDANSIMTVTAQDKATGKEQHIRIESKSSLSDSDIERMKAEAKEHEEEDKKRREEIDKLNSADSLAFQVEKAMNEAGDKLTDDEKKPVQEAVEKLKEVVKDKKYDEVDASMKTVTDFWYPLATKLYGGDQQQGNPFGGFNPGGGNPFGGQ